MVLTESKNKWDWEVSGQMGEIRKQEVCKLTVLRYIYIEVKAMSLQTGSWRIQLTVYIEQRQRSKKKSLSL